MIGVADREGRYVFPCAPLANEHKEMHKLCLHTLFHPYRCGHQQASETWSCRPSVQKGEDETENGQSNLNVGLILLQSPHHL